MMRSAIHLIMALVLALAVAGSVEAVVSYEKGRRNIGGVELLQDAEDSSKYYYLPQYPRLATNPDGAFQFLCMKYVGGSNEGSGGIFHALVAFDLPDTTLMDINSVLDSLQPGARVAGPVRLMQTMDEGAVAEGSFEVVSATLSNDIFASKLITSGHAPLLPGSKAAIAARLTTDGATLLWKTFEGTAASDVSVTVSGYYEAKVPAYQASVSAEMEAVYNHHSLVSNVQQKYSRRQLRDIVDSMQLDGTLDIQETIGSTMGSSVTDTERLKGILKLVTDKLVDLMFDHETGWAKEPARETAVEAGQIQGRQKRGWFGRVFGGASDDKYYTDDQWVRKDKLDVTNRKFYLNLSQSSVVRVPFYASGNLRLVFDSLENRSKYFKVANMEDPDFAKRQVQFLLDGSFTSSFQDLINAASVKFVKKYPSGSGHEDIHRDITFSYPTVNAGVFVDTITFPRLGSHGLDWLDYDIQVKWDLRGYPQPIRIPENPEHYTHLSDPIVVLSPPFEREVIDIDLDLAAMNTAGIRVAVVQIFSTLAGQQKRLGIAKFREGDPETKSITIYRDSGASIAYSVDWQSSELGLYEEPIKYMTGGFILLSVPGPEKFGQ